MKKIYLLGAGTQAHETITYYEATGKYHHLAGCLEEHCTRSGTKVLGIPVLDFSHIDAVSRGCLFLSAIGVPCRKRLIEAVTEKGFGFDILIHPSCIRSERVEILEGCTLAPGVVLTTDIQIGRHVLINANTTIHHDIFIGSYTTVSGNSILCGKVTVGESCFIGAGTTVIQNITIGSGVVIGAGSVVIENVPDNVLIAGNPARIIREINIDDFRI